MTLCVNVSYCTFFKTKRVLRVTNGKPCASYILRCVQVSAAASVVSQALGELLQHVRQYTSRGEPIGRYDQATDTIMNVTENIFSSMGDAGERRVEEETVI